MKRIHTILIVAAVLAGIIISSCGTPKDCRGRRKKAKTAMGGWL